MKVRLARVSRVMRVIREARWLGCKGGLGA